MKRAEKKRSGEPEELELQTPVNDYYESVSERYGVAQVILYMALLAFVSISLLSNTGLITYQNLYYFFKDLNASAETVDVLHTDAVSYPTDVSQSFALYRQGLAVAGNTSVTVFTATGRQVLSQSIQYQNPVAVGSGKYLLVYELGGTQYSLYNSYTQIFSGRTQEPLRGAAVSSSGMYALITQSAQYPSVVELYDSGFDLTGRYPYNAYVTDVALNAKGTMLAVVTSASTNGVFSTRLHVYQPGSTEKLSELEVSDSLGLRCAFTENGNIAILCGGGVYYASVRGTLEAEHSFEGKNLSCADLNESGCVVVLKKSGNSAENEIIVFDKSGKMLYNRTAVEKADAIVLCGGAVFLKQPDGVLRIKSADGAETKVPCTTDQRTLLAVDETRVLLCSPQKAVYYRFGN